MPFKGVDLMKFMGKGSFPQPLIRYYAKQLIAALRDLHDMNIAHKDIKPENVIICKETYDMMLFDYGCSEYFKS